MPVAGEAHKHPAVVRVFLHQLEPEHFGVETLGTLDVPDAEEAVADAVESDGHFVPPSPFTSGSLR